MPPSLIVLLLHKAVSLPCKGIHQHGDVRATPANGHLNTREEDLGFPCQPKLPSLSDDCPSILANQALAS